MKIDIIVLSDDLEFSSNLQKNYFINYKNPDKKLKSLIFHDRNLSNLHIE